MLQRLKSSNDVGQSSSASTEQLQLSVVIPTDNDKQKRRARIIKLRHETHATIIQSRWRGVITRSRSASNRKINPEVMAEPKVLLKKSFSDFNITKRKPLPATTEFSAPPQNHTKNDRVTFQQVSSVVLVIDGAVGLPYCCTATRVSARLLAGGRRDSVVGLDHVQALVANPESSVNNPRYNLQLKWEGCSLLPNSTILCRIDTLEKPLLLPRCLGYAVLKVFVGQSGLQSVATEDFDAGSYLNSGEFSLPLYYGRIPDGELRDETIVETMNAISGAFLRVRLFDSRLFDSQLFDSQYQVDADSRWTLKSKSSMGTGTTATKMTKDADDDSDFGSARTHQLEPTQGATVVESVLQCAQSLPPGQVLQHPIPVNPNQALRILYSRDPFANSKMEATSREQLQVFQQRNHRRMEVIEIVARYVEALFPRLDEIKTVVNPTYIMNYEDSVGSLLSLDMLYNMPNRRNLIRAADESTIVQAIRQGLSSGWDNKIKYFKTVFRYLPGTSDEEFESMNKEASKEFVLDDASVRPVLTSHELSPMYVDDFSCTASLRLTARACLLIQVTAVDVLTSSKISNVEGNTSKDLVSAAHLPSSPQRSRQNSLTGEEIGDTVFAAVDKKSGRLSKLKGLIGIYIGHNDVESTWWGILPLQTTYSGPHQGDASDIPFFAHAGTHLVPLFKGLPPEALIVAADPMQWLLSALKVQRRMKKTSSLYYTIFSKLAWKEKEKEKKKGSLTRSSSVPSMLPSSAMADTGNDPPQSLLLCKGASAVVRLVDARLKKTANSPIAHDASICPSHRTLARILRAYCSNDIDEIAEPAVNRVTSFGNSQATSAPFIYEDDNGAVDERKFNRNFARFSYNSLRNMEDRTILASIPSTIEPEALIQEINQQFYQTVE